MLFTSATPVAVSAGHGAALAPLVRRMSGANQRSSSSDMAARGRFSYRRIGPDHPREAELPSVIPLKPAG
jgi:hypothetical protein